MAKKSVTKDPVAVALDDLLTVLQDLFILEALRAGMNVEDIRKILRIDKRRVTNVSRYLKQAMKRKSGQ